MGKKRLRKGYTSKGKHSNVSRGTLSLMRNERRAHPSVESMTLRNEFLNSFKGKEQAFVLSRAGDLFKKYESRGAKWSACVQAVKTNWIPQFETKWSAR